MDPRGDLRGTVVQVRTGSIARFLDTNVVVYAYDEGEPDKRRVARVLLTSDPNELVVSTQVMLEFYSTATRRLAHPLSEELAAEVVAELSRYRVVGADARLVGSAIDLAREHRVAIWDAMIIRAAQVAGCERLLTEDLHDGARYGDVVIENPFREVAGR